MGVNLSDIVTAHEISLKDLKGRVIAIDAYNSLYQFLSIIRQPDGTPLRDSRGRVTSHLSGLLYRTANYMAEGIKPVYVFDGRPPELKMRTIQERMHVRTRALEEWEEALERGDLEEARTRAQQASFLTRDMVDEAKKLLDHMGVPWVQAPSEGEAQAAFMAQRGDAYASASQDFDSLLFGTPRLVRNMAITGKRKLPRKRVYVEVKPEMLVLNETLKNLEITREQLVDIGILVGTDFNPGIKGIGPKTALKLIKKFGSLERVMDEKGIVIENYEEIRNIFLNPPVTNEYKLQWMWLDEQKLLEFLCEEHDFSRERVLSAVEKIKMFKKYREQRSLDAWF
ncbi:flap structure-specific endonuclease [Aciduliprofundum sp. MAR08-339]|uniref:flap endonuclease-1 n=1 Tax=Aciduliprofundum sp. (strain MAR08-339) TaxID=673860 RepID=UPI0002A4B3FB|nr:flap structure-specific endonuclease [Aciduliprofundum sp. MAR08-339]